MENIKKLLTSFLVKRNRNFDITLFVNAHELAEDFCRELSKNILPKCQNCKGCGNNKDGINFLCEKCFDL